MRLKAPIWPRWTGPVLLAALATAGLGGDASAQCRIAQPSSGTVPYVSAIAARERNAQIFGAVETVQRHVIPALRERKDASSLGYHFYAGTHSIFSALRVPGRACGGESGYSLYGYDLNATSLGFGLVWNRVQLYYGAASTMGNLPLTAEDRTKMTVGNALGAMQYAGMAPLMGSQDFAKAGQTMTGQRVDYVAGIDVDTPYLGGRLGYVGSGGLYGSVDQRAIRAFFSAVARDAFQSMPYLKSGLESLSWLYPKPFVERWGDTSAFVRRLQYQGLRQTDMASNMPTGSAAKTFDFWTLHMKHQDLWRFLDAEFAVSLAPTTLLHLARLRAHGAVSGFVFAATGGVVQQPDMFYYGVPGGLKRHFSADAGYARRKPGKDPITARFSIRFNDPEVLSLFPYAVDAWSFMLHAAWTRGEL